MERRDHLLHVDNHELFIFLQTPADSSHLIPLQPPNTVANVNVHCGTGEQVVRWLGYVACSQLSYLLGETPGRYVPQAVLAADGRVLDVDYVRLLTPGAPFHTSF